MQLPSENTDINRDRLWDRDEIKQLIDYANYLKGENEDLQAKMIMMQAKLSNEEAKVKQFKNLINLMTNGAERN